MSAFANQLHPQQILHITRNIGSKVAPATASKAAPVIVCSCNALRESQIREAARSGIRCEREAYAKLGCRPQCGQCLSYARELVRAESARL